MLNTITFPISPKQPRRMPLAVARRPYPCPLQEVHAPLGIGGPRSTGLDLASSRPTHVMHGRELNEIQAPEALANSAFAVSTWWSIREGARRLLSRFYAS